MQMVLSHDGSIVVSNGQQPPVTSATHHTLLFNFVNVYTMVIIYMCTHVHPY